MAAATTLVAGAVLTAAAVESGRRRGHRQAGPLMGPKGVPPSGLAVRDHGDVAVPPKLTDSSLVFAPGARNIRVAQPGREGGLPTWELRLPDGRRFRHSVDPRPFGDIVESRAPVSLTVFDDGSDRHRYSQLRTDAKVLEEQAVRASLVHEDAGLRDRRRAIRDAATRSGGYFPLRRKAGQLARLGGHPTGVVHEMRTVHPVRVRGRVSAHHAVKEPRRARERRAAVEHRPVLEDVSGVQFKASVSGQRPYGGGRRRHRRPARGIDVDVVAHHAPW